ncbi:phosphodiester glycosidase family protein [Streptomyces sp. NPDC029003]|uniref:phosphodiester glycosidase family protein n=1 Tax=Streptomyces sp. NPDC029003 TaxID=3155125 RepID=UPI00340EA14D
MKRFPRLAAVAALVVAGVAAAAPGSGPGRSTEMPPTDARPADTHRQPAAPGEHRPPEPLAPAPLAKTASPDSLPSDARPGDARPPGGREARGDDADARPGETDPDAAGPQDGPEDGGPQDGGPDGAGPAEGRAVRAGPPGAGAQGDDPAGTPPEDARSAAIRTARARPDGADAAAATEDGRPGEGLTREGLTGELPLVQARVPEAAPVELLSAGARPARVLQARDRATRMVPVEARPGWVLPAQPAPGVTYRAFSVSTPHGSARVHLVEADLSGPGVRADLLYPGSVTDRAPVSQMARRQGAVAAVNGDFFHMLESQHPGVAATGSASGPQVMHGRPLKAAVPEGQRFGWKPLPGDSAQDVVGVGTDGKARTGRLRLSGRVETRTGGFRLGGYNQYALPVGSVGLFTTGWGSASRARAVCGTDNHRSGPCADEVYEVTVRRGEVVSGTATPGSGPVGAGTQILLGREAGARLLRALTPGTRVRVDYGLDAGSQTPFRFALGAHAVLRGGRVLSGLDARTAEPRTAVGIADAGDSLFLLATDGREGTSTGLTVRELAGVLQSLGCTEGLYMDGGASSTLATRDPGSGQVSVRNHLQQGAERRVPNGIAIIAGRGGAPSD